MRKQSRNVVSASGAPRTRGRDARGFLVGLLASTLSLFTNTGAYAAFPGTPGLPFSENFASTALRDTTKSTANWSTTDQALLLAWSRRHGDMSAAFGTDISIDAGRAMALVLGDVDGDGDLDLVAGNYSGTARLYLNNGTADPFNGIGGISISSDAKATTSVALGDMDGDGDLDLVVGNDAQTNRLYLNNGSASPFSGVVGTDIGSDADHTLSVVLGDVDSDGDLDLVAGNNGEINRLYLSNGTAAPFTGVSGTNISSYAGHTTSVVLGDVDSDGDLDLVAGNTGETSRLYLNNGGADPFNGSNGTNISSDANITTSVVLGDMDGDGDLDLVAGNSGQTTRLYVNNGTVAPFNGVNGTNISSDTNNTRAVVIGDVDGDGDLDLVTGNYGSTSRLYLNNGTASPFTAVSGTNISNDANNTRAIVLGDVDGDGTLDLAVGNEAAANRLYRNNGATDALSGVVGTDITSDVRSTAAIALGDVDGDGDVDIVVGNVASTNRLYLNNGTFDPFNGVIGTDISSDARYTYSVALGDMDRDGDLDLVAGNYGSTSRLYLNNGTADPFNGVSGIDISNDKYATLSVALGDVDRDGDLDVAAGNSGATNRIYLNNGTADPFNGVIGADISSDARHTYSIALGDVDGDHDLDVVAGNAGAGETSRLYLNNGAANPFNGVAGTDISSDKRTTLSIALGDMNGDGHLDLVTGNYGTTNRLYLNNGTAYPFIGVSGTDVSSDAHATRSVTLGDVDGDHDLDLVTGNSGETNRTHLNNGTANPFNGVVGTDISNDKHGTYAVALGDMDGDGKLNLVAGNLGATNRLYLNHSLAAAVIFDTSKGDARSLRVDTESSTISVATLTATASTPANTSVDYYLSNNGGTQWFQVKSGVLFTFPTAGHDLRWRAILHSLSPKLTPRVTGIAIAGVNSAPDPGTVPGAVNSAPTDIALSASTVNSNAGANAAVGMLTTTDADAGDTHSYSLAAGIGANNNAAFTIASDVLHVTDPSAMAGSYSVRIKTDDGHGGTFEKVFPITVTAMPATTTDTVAPIVYACPSNIAASTAPGASTAVVSWTTPTSIDAVDGPIAAALTTGLASGSAFPAGVITQTYTFTDHAGNSAQCSFTVTVTKTATSNSAPTDITLSATTLYSNAGANAFVGTLTTTDADVGDSHTYSLVSGSGATDNAAFTVSSNMLRVINPSVMTGSYSVRIKTDDGHGGTFEKAFSISVMAPPATLPPPTTDTTAPIVSACPGNITANTAPGASTAVVSWDTPLGFDTVDGIIAAVRTTGLAPGSAFPVGIIQQTYTFTDHAGNVASCSFSVTVTNTANNNAVPTDIALSATTLKNSAGANAVVGTLTTTDADAGDSHSYSLVTGSGATHNASFIITSDVLRAINPSAMAGSYSVRIKTDDGHGGTFEKVFVITVTASDIPAPPLSVDPGSSDGGGGGGAFDPALLLLGLLAGVRRYAKRT